MPGKGQQQATNTEGTPPANDSTMRTTSIAERHDVNAIIPGREPFTSDLTAFDAYLHRMKMAERLDQDPPFNEIFWAHVRSLLEKATPSGFLEEDTGNQRTAAEDSSSLPTFTLKTQTDINVVLEKMKVFNHIMPCAPNLLAKDTGIPLSDILTELFYSTKVGLTDMIWIPECFRCGGSVCHKGLLENLPREAYCSGCTALTKLDYLDQIKTYFIFTSNVFYAPMPRIQHFPLMLLDVPITRFLAMAIPTGSKNCGFSYILDSAIDATDGAAISKHLTKGKYRVLDACTGIVFILEVMRNATPNDKLCHANLRASAIHKAEFGQELTSIAIPHGKVSLDLIADTDSVYMPFIVDYMPDEDQLTVPPEFRTPYLSAAECFHHPSFAKLFPNQIVSRNAMFKIQRVVLVFTDVVGSTELYEAAGDGPALDIVQTHFMVLFGALSVKGRVVKTIGDAVMAAFTNGSDAIHAVAQALRRMPIECRLPDGTALSIRVGIHVGPTVVVPLNGINDYFGSTVNQSARVEGKAENAECLVTEAVLEELSAQAAFEELTSDDFVETRDVSLPLKGVAKPIRCKGFRLKTK